MKKFIIIMTALLLLIPGCTSNVDLKTNQKEFEGEQSYNLLYKINDSDLKVTINGYYTEPDSINHSNTLILDGLAEGEFVEFIVSGEIKDFEHIELKWDEEKQELREQKIINHFDQLTNQTVIIKTYMPEGIPSEKIKWKSLSGKSYEFIIAEQ